MLNLIRKTIGGLVPAVIVYNTTRQPPTTLDDMPKPKVNRREDAVHYQSRCKVFADGEHYVRADRLIGQGGGVLTCDGCAQFLWGLTNIEEEDYIDELL